MLLTWPLNQKRKKRRTLLRDKDEESFYILASVYVFSNLLQDMQTIGLTAFELQIAIYPMETASTPVFSA